MKTFSNFIDEMAVNTGIVDKSYLSFKHEWDKNYRNLPEGNIKTLLLKDIGSEHCKIYRVGSTNHVLVSQSNEYLGYIELHKLYNTYRVGGSNSVLTRGFYNVMFTSLLSLGGYDEFISDTQLSNQAIVSYEKLAINGALSLKIIDSSGEYYTFSKDTLLSNPTNRISISSKNGKHKKYIQEVFEDYYIKISDNTSSLHRAFINREDGLNNHLFCENFLQEV